MDESMDESLDGVELPMFPLGTVLFPHGVLPLRVFEPRYRLMIAHCLEQDARFGVVLIERGSEVGGGDTRFHVGTVAQIVYLGTLMQFHVDTAAERRFVVHQLSSDASDTIDQGDEVTLTWPVDDTSILTVG